MMESSILPSHGRNQLAEHLLAEMEKVLKEMGIRTAYTFARSISLPLNATFTSSGYDYGGTLWNNTKFSGEIESMNVWYKELDT